MKLWIAVVVAICIGGSTASAQPDIKFPTREIHAVVGFPAGSGADIVARYFARELAILAGKPVLVENKVGASGNLAHTYAAKSQPDGYTLYFVGAGTLVSSRFLFKQPPVDPLKDFTPVATLVNSSWLVVVDAKNPAKNLRELTIALKEKGEKAFYGTATTNGLIVSELYNRAAGLKMQPVQYKSVGDAVNDLSAGRIDMLLADSGWAVGQAAAGRIKILSASTAKRQPALPDIPTMEENGVSGIDFSSMWMAVLPAGASKQLVDVYAGWFAAILAKPETAEFFKNTGASVKVSTPDETAALLKRELDSWVEYVKAAKITPN